MNALKTPTSKTTTNVSRRVYTPPVEQTKIPVVVYYFWGRTCKDGVVYETPGYGSYVQVEPADRTYFKGCPVGCGSTVENALKLLVNRCSLVYIGEGRFDLSTLEVVSIEDFRVVPAPQSDGRSDGEAADQYGSDGEVADEDQPETIEETVEDASEPLEPEGSDVVENTVKKTITCTTCGGVGIVNKHNVCWTCGGQGVEEVHTSALPAVRTAAAPVVKKDGKAKPVPVQTSTKAKKTAPAAPAAAPTKTKRTAPAESSNGNGSGSRSGELRKPMVRILACLAKARSPMARKEISEKAPCDLPFLTNYLGNYDSEQRAANEEKRGFKSLLTLGYVKQEQHDVDGRDVMMYEITANGRKALERANKGE